MRDILKHAYNQQKGNAKYRGIPFLLTFDEWRTIWATSGKWNQRGTQRGHYVMARPGDRGAYEVGNVVIVLAEQNRAERNQNYTMKGADNPAAGKNYWITNSAETRQRRSAAISAANSKPKSSEMRVKLAAAITGRRKVYRDGRSTFAYPGDPDYPVIT